MTLRNILRIILAVAGLTLTGCAGVPSSRSVASGERVEVNFTCSLKNGDIVVSTSKAITDNASLAKSTIFVPRAAEGALTITAGSKISDDDTIFFEDRVTGMIATTVVGMTPGEGYTVQLRAERKDKDSRGQETIVRMSRHTNRPSEIEMTQSEFLFMTGKAPVEGAEIFLGEGMLARVLSSSGDAVKLKVSPTADALISTPYGQGRVTETLTDLKVSYDAPVGTLVRTGPLVGRIAVVDDNFITLDYAHPFGGEELTCDVAVVSVAMAVKDDAEHVGH